MSAEQSSEKYLLESLAEESGLAIVVVDENSSVIAEVNNNSICRALYDSEEFAPRCAEFCGKAFQMAHDAGESVAYQCYAGLNCIAVPLTVPPAEQNIEVAKENESGEPNAQNEQLEQNKRIGRAAIVGRTFLQAAKYRAATERAIAGDWQEFVPDEFFENILLTGSAETLENTARRLGREAETRRRGDEEKKGQGDKKKAGTLVNSDLETENQGSETENRESKAENRETSVENQKLKIEDQRPKNEDRLPFTAHRSPLSENAPAWRAFFGSLLKLDYRQACVSVLEFLENRYGLISTIWLDRRDDVLEIVATQGNISQKQIQIGVAGDDRRLLEAAQNETALKLRQRRDDEPESNTAAAASKNRTIYLFPVAVGTDIRSALVVADQISDDEKRREIARFCRSVASELEILRLREELSARDVLRTALRKFNEGLKKIDADDFWLSLTQISAELLHAERASLLVYNEKAQILQTKAAVGAGVDLLAPETSGKIGERVALKVLEKGEPLVVNQIDAADLPQISDERKYLTESFISYPITIGTRKIGVLNFTDRADRKSFGQLDVEILRSIAPQIAVAIDHANLRSETGELRHLSVTDALTGLVNRRYLQERLTEEIKRSNRHGYPMAFLMIDVDFFKSYNDQFGHTEGDRALKIVGNALKETLRGADVAARYGGEEFSILLPQTTGDEAETIAERVRRNIDETEFPNRKVTISIGIASCSITLNTCDNLVAAADKALYAAKEKGRNNVQVYENLENEI